MPVMGYGQIWNETASKNDWFNLKQSRDRSGLTEKYLTEKKTSVGIPEVNVLIKIEVEMWSSHKTWRYLVLYLLLDGKIKGQ